MASWLETFFSPTKLWIIRRRLTRYGHFFNNFLNGFKDNQIETVNVSNDEAQSKSSLKELKEIETIIGYTFNNRSLLYEAFTHPSYRKDCVSYERLEYIGDAVLNLLITKEQFSTYPNLAPGSLTSLRAANVDTEKLARVAVRHNFHRYIRLDTPVLDKQIQAFINALPKHPVHSHGLLSAPKVLADVVESTVGAVFIDSDCSTDKTWEVASDLLKPVITPKMLQKNPVRKLFEICQKYKLKVRLVDKWSQEGTYQVFVNNQLKGKGMCREKKDIALNRAANDAYKEVAKMMSSKT